MDSCPDTDIDPKNPRKKKTFTGSSAKLNPYDE